MLRRAAEPSSRPTIHAVSTRKRVTFRRVITAESIRRTGPSA